MCPAAFSVEKKTRELHFVSLNFGFFKKQQFSRKRLYHVAVLKIQNPANKAKTCGTAEHSQAVSTAVDVNSESLAVDKQGFTHNAIPPNPYRAQHWSTASHYCIAEARTAANDSAFPAPLSLS